MLNNPKITERRLPVVTILSVMAFVFAYVQVCVADAAKPEWRKCDPHKDKVLYTVGYAHLDTQWRWTYQDSIYTFIPNTMNFNFDLLEKYPDYHFNFTGARRYAMMKEYYPADYERVKDYIAKGRWYVSGSSVDENDANVPSPESVIRQVLYGNHWFSKEFGKTSEDYMLPDCFGFTASLPSALAHAGLKGFSTQKLTWGSPIGIPFNVGIWEGPDGNSIAAALKPQSYSSKVTSDLSNSAEWLDRIDANGKKSGFNADFKYYGTGDRGGSPTEESVKWVQTAANSDGPICVVPGSSDKIFRDMTPADMSKMPRYKGDLLLTQHSAGSLTSEAYMKRWNRKNELLIDGAERASVIAAWLGGSEYQIDRLNDAWFLILGNQMHDILPGTSVPKAYEFSWNDEIIAQNSSAGVLGNAVGAAARQLDTQVKGVPVVVYNPLATAREDIVQAKLRFGSAAPSAVRVYGPDGKEVPSQIAGKDGDAVEVVFLAKMPSVGLAVYDVRKSDKPCSMATGLKVSKDGLENGEYRVKIDSNGDVAGIFDKTAGRELLSAPSQLQFLEDSPREYPAWNMDWDDRQLPPLGIVRGPAKVRIVENGPARVAIEVVRIFKGSTFRQTLRLAAGGAGDRFELDNSIDWRTEGGCLKASFPMTAANKVATYNLGLGTIQRPNNDSGKYEVPSRQWFDLTDAGGGFGAAILEDSKFGSDKPDDNTVRLTLLRTPKCRDFFDQATQDFGRHNILYAVAGHKNDWRASGIAWRGARLNQPLVAFTAPAHKGWLGKSFSFMKISTPQVGASAIKKAEDSDEIVVRLQELYGTPANGVSVAFASPVVSAREVDGQERNIGGATIKDGALVVDMGGYSPRTFAVKLAPAKIKENAPRSAPITLSFDTSVASADGEKSESGFDGKGNSFPAEMIPAAVTVDDIAFKLGAGGAGKKNALACRGQKLALPAGKYNRLYLLAASSGGDVAAAFKIDGKATKITVQEWTGFIGQWDDRVWKNDREISGLRPAFAKRDELAWFASHLHNKNGKNEAYNYSYLFKYKIDLPTGAKSLMLPDDPRIKVFAATAAYNENDAAVPAQPLYDVFKEPSEPPMIEPAEGKYKDSVQVEIHKSWYAGFGRIYYTTDGSEPTVKSRQYTGPFWIDRDTKVRARAFNASGAGSPVFAAVFGIADSTPPGVVSVSAFDSVQSLIVKYSEPVAKADAEKTSAYTVTPDLGIASVSLGPDGRTVRLKLNDAPKIGEEYMLAVSNVRDVSPSANALKSMQPVEFSIVPPVLDLKFTGKDNSISMGSVPKGRDYELRGNPSIKSGKFGPALHISGGIEECLKMGDRPEFDPVDAITLSVWIKPEDWNGNRHILAKGENEIQYRLLKSGDRLAFDITGVGEVAAPLPTPGSWHHIAATYDGAAMRIYVNGVKRGEKAASGAIPVTSDPLYIGSKSANAARDEYFKGDIDKVMIWNYALSAEHIKKLAGEE